MYKLKAFIGVIVCAALISATMCVCADSLAAGTDVVYNFDNIEDYSNGEVLSTGTDGHGANNALYILSTGSTSEARVVSDGEEGNYALKLSYSGNNSFGAKLNFRRAIFGNDNTYLTEGIYAVEWDAKFPSADKGLSLQQFGSLSIGYDPSSARDDSFRMVDGVAASVNNGNTAYTYRGTGLHIQPDKYYKFKQIVDLDNKKAMFYCDGEYYGESNYSNSSLANNRLNFLNFNIISTQSNVAADLYIDNLKISRQTTSFISSVPANKATAVAADSEIRLSFSNPVTSAFAQNSVNILSEDSSPVDYTITENDGMGNFTLAPLNGLENGSGYVIQIKNNVNPTELYIGFKTSGIKENKYTSRKIDFDYYDDGTAIASPTFLDVFGMSDGIKLDGTNTNVFNNNYNFSTTSGKPGVIAYDAVAASKAAKLLFGENGTGRTGLYAYIPGAFHQGRNPSTGVNEVVGGINSGVFAINYLARVDNHSAAWREFGTVCENVKDGVPNKTIITGFTTNGDDIYFGGKKIASVADWKTEYKRVRYVLNYDAGKYSVFVDGDPVFVNGTLPEDTTANLLYFRLGAAPAGSVKGSGTGDSIYWLDDICFEYSASSIKSVADTDSAAVTAVLDASGKTVTFNVEYRNHTVAKNAVIFACIYSGEETNSLLASAAESVSFGNLETKTTGLTIDVPAGLTDTAYAKVFVVDGYGNITPMCPALTWR